MPRGNNIYDPMRVTEIPILRDINSWELPYISRLTQEEYDLMNIHDCKCIYVISDHPGRVYYMGKLIVNDKSSSKYLLGTEYNPASKDFDYTIYMKSNPESASTTLVRICRFNNGMDALTALNSFNAIGSHEPIPMKISSLIIEYIDGNIDLTDFIISCISAFGYKDDPRLQELVSLVISKKMKSALVSNNANLSADIIRTIEKIAKTKDNVLIKAFPRIYDVIVKYIDICKNNFSKSQWKQLNFSDTVREICEVGYDLGIL